MYLWGMPIEGASQGQLPQGKQQRPTWRRPGNSQLASQGLEVRLLPMEHLVNFQSENCAHINTLSITRASGRRQRAFHGKGRGKKRRRKHMDKTPEEVVSCLLCINTGFRPLPSSSTYCGCHCSECQLKQFLHILKAQG